MPLSLYELDSRLAALEEDLIAAGGEITDDIEEVHGDLLDMRADKAEGYLRIIRRNETSAKAVDEEIDRLRSMQKAFANTASRLKSRLADSMKERGEDLIETPLGKFRLQYAAAPCEVVASVDELPDRFVRRADPVPDVAAIKAALKAEDPEAAAVARWGERSHFVRLY